MVSIPLSSACPVSICPTRLVGPETGAKRGGIRRDEAIRVNPNPDPDPNRNHDTTDLVACLMAVIVVSPSTLAVTAELVIQDSQKHKY